MEPELLLHNFGEALGPSLQAVALITFYLLVLFVTTAIIQARKSGKAGARIKEDLKYYGHSDVPTPTPTPSPEDDDAQRWRRIVQNNTENFPLDITIILGATVLWGKTQPLGTSVPGGVLIGFYAVYAAARTAFVFAYAFELQPWRSIAYTLGRVSVLAIILAVIVCSFQGW